MPINRNDIKGNYSEELVNKICFMVAETGDFVAFVKEYMYDDDPIVVRNALGDLILHPCGQKRQEKDLKQEI